MFTPSEFVTGQMLIITTASNYPSVCSSIVNVVVVLIFQSEDPRVMMESTNLVTELISILIRKHELFFPESDDEELHPTRPQPG